MYNWLLYVNTCSNMFVCQGYVYTYIYIYYKKTKLILSMSEVAFFKHTGAMFLKAVHRAVHIYIHYSFYVINNFSL